MRLAGINLFKQWCLTTLNDAGCAAKRAIGSALVI